MEFKKGGYIEFKPWFALQTSPRPGGEGSREVGGIRWVFIISELI